MLNIGIFRACGVAFRENNCKFKISVPDLPYKLPLFFKNTPSFDFKNSFSHAKMHAKVKKYKKVLDSKQLF